MPAKGDPLLTRAAAAIRSARDVRTETRQIVDTMRLARLRRELAAKIVQIERLASRRDGRSAGVSPAGSAASRR